MRREAVLSSRIEGTQASLSDLFIYEASGVRRRDVVEVVNYVLALEQGITLLEDLPISVRLINKLHERLLEGVRGEEKGPGVFRTEQVWIGSEGTAIGDSRFIPPPASMVRDLMFDWEKFVNEPTDMPPLVQCALMHYQFEAIHPFLDGNGRIGRLLITLFLRAKEILPTPLLYLSGYFERDRNLYYNHLFDLSATGDWEGWLRYFLRGTTEQARDALRRVRRMRELQDEYRRALQERKESGNALRLVEELFASPVMTTARTAKTVGVTQAGARGILERLVRYGIVQELEGMWPKHFVATELLNIVQMARAPETA